MKLKNRLKLYDYFHPTFLFEDPNDPTLSENSILRKKALPFEFPLTKEDKNHIIRFMLFFDNRDREDITLTAPQIGISKQLIAFSVPVGRGIIQPFPKTVWLNPTYEKITDEMEEEYDVCPSTAFAVPVKRYRRIHYKAFDLGKNTFVEGEARGVTARVIQHETDHLDGILITDLAPRDQFISYKEYRERRKAKWNGKGWQDCIEEMREELEQLRASYPPMPKPKKRYRKLIKSLRTKEAVKAKKKQSEKRENQYE